MSQLGLFGYCPETQSVGDGRAGKVAVSFDVAVKAVSMRMSIWVSRVYLDTIDLVVCGNPMA